MKCKDVEFEIAGGAPLSAAAQEHLLRCASCQKFAQTCVLANGRVAPSAEVDFAVLSSWRRLSRKGYGIWRRWMIPAVAAAVAMVFSLCWLSLPQREIKHITPEYAPMDAEAAWQTEWTVTEGELQKLEMILAYE